MTDRELLQQALDALEVEAYGWELPPARTRNAIKALRARLAQPEPEPYGYLWFTKHMEHRFTHRMPNQNERVADVTPIYTAPTQREWVGLTDEEIRAEWLKVIDPNGGDEITALARGIERLIRSKNEQA